MPKVDYADLESVTKFLDKLASAKYAVDPAKCKELSKMIKDKYTKIKPHYDKD